MDVNIRGAHPSAPGQCRKAVMVHRKKPAGLFAPGTRTGCHVFGVGYAKKFAGGTFAGPPPLPFGRRTANVYAVAQGLGRRSGGRPGPRAPPPSHHQAWPTRRRIANGAFIEREIEFALPTGCPMVRLAPAAIPISRTAKASPAVNDSSSPRRNRGADRSPTCQLAVIPWRNSRAAWSRVLTEIEHILPFRAGNSRRTNHYRRSGSGIIVMGREPSAVPPHRPRWREAISRPSIFPESPQVSQPQTFARCRDRVDARAPAHCVTEDGKKLGRCEGLAHGSSCPDGLNAWASARAIDRILPGESRPAVAIPGPTSR